MMKRLLPWLAVMAAAGVLAACNNGGNTTPTPGPTCQPPSGMQIALVYPAPNATAVPDSFGQVIIGTSPAMTSPGVWDIVATSGNSNVPGSNLQGTSPPFPTPNATPSFPNPAYYTSSFAGVSASPGSTIQVYLNNTTTNCTPLLIGQFTAQ